MDVSLAYFGVAQGQEIAAALQRAVDTCGSTGGGRVTIPAGLWRIDNDRSVWVRWDNVTIQGEGANTVVEVVNWQPFRPGDPRQYASIVVGDPARDVSGFRLRRLAFVGTWDVDHHAPWGVQHDSKGLVMLGWPSQANWTRRTVIEDVSSHRCGSYLLSVTGNHDGLRVERCSVSDQWASAYACVGAGFASVPILRDCSATRIAGNGIQWTGPVQIERYHSLDCRSGGVLLINNDDASLWSVIDGGRIERAGNTASETEAGSAIYVGGEYYGGRNVRVRGVQIVDSYGSGICWAGGALKQIEIEECSIIGVGLGCGTDDPSRAGIGKASGIQPTAGISLAGYAILLRHNTIQAHHEGYGAGQVCARFGIWLGATDETGQVFQPEMAVWPDCAFGDAVGGEFGEARLALPANASDA